MLYFKRLSAACTTAAFALLSAPHAAFAAEPTTVVGTVDNSSVIASCSLVLSPDTQAVTPVVVLQQPYPSGTTDIRFTFYDAVGKIVGTPQVVGVAPPPATGLPPPLPAFTRSFAFSAVRCDTKSETAAVSPPPSGSPVGGGGGGGGTAILLGVLGGGALIALAAGHGGGSTSSGAQPTPVPTNSPTPVPTNSPTPVPTNSPTPVPTNSPSPVPSNSPSPVPSNSPTPTPTPTSSPTPGSVMLTVSTMNFYTANGTQATVASQSGYSGPFSVTSMTCSASVATIAQSGSTFTVTSVAAGPTCTFTIGGGNGKTATLTVNVTTSSGTISTRRRSADPGPRPGSSPRGTR
jgi:hypothetical protein